MRKVIGFHKPDEEYGFLSNWYLSDFTVDGIKFSSMEQYMMYMKAIVFDDKSIASQIMETSDVATIKDLGRRVSNYNDTIWNGMRQPLIYKGLLEKFRQNEELKKELLETEDAILAECAYSDLIWGIGIRMDDPDKNDMNKWRGTNLLGFTLMLVRNEIKK
ncbi:hypothetical protein SAMN04487760_1053 [Lachnospiraceae bacterium G41]|nr:hypothetical protein SAMN04487760_1053 [Lachnospiraceae bacterium G41]